jgi:hypothetical protein
MAPEVLELMEELHMTNRDVNNFYRIFQNLREHDPITVSTLPNEVCTSSILWLVRNDRDYIVKILYNLVELGGYKNVVPWDGFLWIMLRFCTLSKLEACQVLFYIIAKEMKSWTLHLLTNSQLEEFFEEWIDSPIASFDCATIRFDALPKTKYSMVDFCELCSRYGSLVNPVLHLQRSIQQSMPSLRFWSDYDRIKVQNRFIPLDFFRYRKSRSISDLINKTSSMDMERELLIAKASIGEENLKALQREHATGSYVNSAHKFAGKGLPLPHVPGTKKLQGSRRRGHVEPKISWIEDMQKTNMDPVRGYNLGSAVPPIPKELLPQPEVAKLIVTFKECGPLPMPTHARATCGIEGRPATVVSTKSVFSSTPKWNEVHDINGYIADESKNLEFNILDAKLLVNLLLPQRKFYPHGFEGPLTWPGGKLHVKVVVTLPKTIDDAHKMLTSTFSEETRLAKKHSEIKAIVAKLKHMKEDKKALNRVQELSFIRDSRGVEPRRSNIVDILQKSSPCELIDRPHQSIIGRKGKDLPH